MRPRESTVEASFVRVLKRHGLTTLKLNLQGNRGFPDRIVLCPGGRAVFVELKRPGGKLRPLQGYVHAQLKALGFQVAVLDDAVDAVAWVLAHVPRMSKVRARSTDAPLRRQAARGAGVAVLPVVRHGA